MWNLSAGYLQNTLLSVIVISKCFWLFFILCLSLREPRHSLLHVFQAASLQHLMYFFCFLITLLSSSNCSSGIAISCPCIRMFDVNTGDWTSSSIYSSGGFLKCISLSRMPSSSSCLFSFKFQVALHKRGFTSLAMLLKSPPHHGALIRWNFHCTYSLTITKTFCFLSSL